MSKARENVCGAFWTCESQISGSVLLVVEWKLPTQFHFTVSPAWIVVVLVPVVRSTKLFPFFPTSTVTVDARRRPGEDAARVRGPGCATCFAGRTDAWTDVGAATSSVKIEMAASVVTVRRACMACIETPPGTTVGGCTHDAPR